MEATGTYWFSLFSALTDKGFNVSVFNPCQIKSFRGAYTNRTQKNDVIDSVIIFLEKQVDDLEVKIKSIYSKPDNHLQSIPGIGESLAPVIS